MFLTALQSTNAFFKLCLAGLILLTLCSHLAGESGNDRATVVVNAAIQALGGERYLAVRNTVSEGRYFFYRNGRKSFAKFFDWTVFEDPVKSRFQFGKGKRAEVTVHNLGLNKGWVKVGPFDLKELTEKEMEEFRRSIMKELDYILRNRRSEDGLSMFYYGPDDISGDGVLEAVEFIDRVNDSVIIYFDRKSHFPNKVESHFTGDLGIRHKRAVEFYNWHDTDGVQAPLRSDTYVDGELSSQTFLEIMRVNQVIPEDYFLKPTVKERKQKKKKN